jgi:hypothetical protein
MAHTRRVELVTEAARYAHDRSWPVVPGAFPLGGGCSCGRLDCRRPGAHPFDDHWRLAATTDAQTIRWWWWHRPAAPIVVPTGVRFDALDVPDTVGARALALLRACGQRLGPVLTEGDRWLFLVARPTPAEAAEGCGRLDAAHLDIRYRSEGDWLIAPPSRVPAGNAAWQVSPGDAAARWPGAGELLGPLAWVARCEPDLVARVPELAGHAAC